MIPKPLRKYIFFADRWQHLVDLGDGKTRYETIEVFGGLLAWFVLLLRGGLRQGFKAFAEDLKRRSETL